ncbi:MAG: Nif3-like dinuclear metal center hexameric protein [Treponemataceae bacterium]|nr:MAG: Nif3-like dinuclear metal center hexameric protein [Treponemataceae bacterium]
MTLTELDEYLCEYLKIAVFPDDPSKNGIQVESGGEIKKIAFAVDACMETIRRAAALKADMLFVHHGILWKDIVPIRGVMYNRVKELIQNNIALFACHLPLDAHHECGNNYGLARMLNMQNLEPFGEWKGYTIGVKGTLPAPLTPEGIINKLFPGARGDCVVLPFGKEKLANIAIVSGGGAEKMDQACDAGADAFITGEIGHTQYHYAEERRITVIAAGHYVTETAGVQLLMKKIEREFGIETIFIDVPTGM